MSNRSEILPRYLIDRVFEQITNHDLVDKWNYCTQVSHQFVNHIKSGHDLAPETNFLSPSRFSRFNSISTDELYKILSPAFLESRDIVVSKLLSDFDEFIISLKSQIQTVHAKSIFAGGNPKEDPGQQIISAAVFGYFYREGFVYQEVPSGIGYIDILICTDREIIIEAKLHSNYDPTSKQLEEYVQAGLNRIGYYFVFDTTRSFTNKVYCDIENSRFPPESGYAVIVCHVNPPAPSLV